MVDRGAAERHARRGAQTLVDDRADLGQHVLDAVVQLAWIRCCNLSAASRSSASMPGLDE